MSSSTSSTRRRIVIAATFGAFSAGMPRAASAWHACCLTVVGVVRLRAENLPLWVAESEKLFDPWLRDLRVFELNNTDEVLRGVQEKTLDVGYAAQMGIAIERVVKNRDVVVIGSVVNQPLYYAVSKTDLGPWSGLEGRPIGVFRGDEIARYVTQRALTAENIPADKITFIEFPDRRSLERSVDIRSAYAAVSSPAQAFFMEARGFRLRELGRDPRGPLATYGILMNRAWTKSHASDDPRLGALMAGLIRSHAWLRDSKNKDGAIAIIKQRLPGLDPERIYNTFIVTQQYLAENPAPSRIALENLVRIPAISRRLKLRDLPDDLIDTTPFSLGAKRI